MLFRVRASAIGQSPWKSHAVKLCLIATLGLGACADQNTPPLESRLGSSPSHTYKGGRAENGYGGGGRSYPNQTAAANAFKGEAGDLVYFSSDSSDLTPESRQTLDAQARWLASSPSQTVTIEGHADEHGTREYNIALGARRATAVSGYLSSHGVNSARIRTLSYGKERPVASCDDISCWSKNRRAQTVLGATAVSRN